MAQADKMTCPDCGVEMNFHAEKIDYTASLDEPSQVDPDLGGILEEFHACPVCGRAAVRKAS